MGYWNERLKKEAWNPFKRDPVRDFQKAVQDFQWSAPDTTNCKSCKYQGQTQPATHVVRFLPPPNPYKQMENPDPIYQSLGETWERDHTPYDQYLCPQHLQSFQEEQQSPGAHPHMQNYTVSQL